MENGKNKDEINNLVDRAMEDLNNNDTKIDEKIEDFIENGEESVDREEVTSSSEFNGYFHERDSLAVNNIVDEV